MEKNEGVSLSSVIALKHESAHTSGAITEHTFSYLSFLSILWYQYSLSGYFFPTLFEQHCILLYKEMIWGVCSGFCSKEAESKLP